MPRFAPVTSATGSPSAAARATPAASRTGPEEPHPNLRPAALIVRQLRHDQREGLEVARLRVAKQRPAAARGGRRNYRLSQYDSFTRKVLSGGRVNRSPRSPAMPRVPSAPVEPWRPWLHTTNSVEPGRYSQRNTIFERNCFLLNPPGCLVP